MLLVDPLCGTANGSIRLGQRQTATGSAGRCFAACVCGGSFSTTSCSVQLPESTYNLSTSTTAAIQTGDQK